MTNIHIVKIKENLIIYGKIYMVMVVIIGKIVELWILLERDRGSMRKSMRKLPIERSGEMCNHVLYAPMRNKIKIWTN